MKAFRILQLMAVAAILIIAVAISGCGGSGDRQANEATADTINQTVNSEATSMLYEFPTPFEVTNMLQQAQAGYIFDITNPPSNVTKYQTERAKALNLGIYSADLAYSATYNRTDETNQFLAATGKLADELGIAGVYDQTLMDKMKKYGNNKDSLVALIKKVLGNTNDFLSKNNRNQISALVAAGGFIESLYLSTSLNLVAKNNAQITDLILKQQDNYDKLVSILDAYKQDKNVLETGQELAKLKALFTDYGMEPGKGMTRERAGQMNDLVESVRNSWIK